MKKPTYSGKGKGFQKLDFDTHNYSQNEEESEEEIPTTSAESVTVN